MGRDAELDAAAEACTTTLEASVCDWGLRRARTRTAATATATMDLGSGQHTGELAVTAVVAVVVDVEVGVKDDVPDKMGHKIEGA